MFSEELRILDNNTVKYMVDQLEEEIKEKDAMIADKESTIAKLQAELEQYKQHT